MKGVAYRPTQAPRNGKFPKWVFAMAFAISLAANVFGGLQLRQLHGHFLLTSSRHNAILESVGRILWYDEVLTMSARMAAATGDLTYQNRYEQFDKLLVKEIAALAERLPADDMRAKVAATNAANDRLISMERKSFAAVRQGHLAEAMALLNSRDYTEAKIAYAEGIESSRQRADETIAADRQHFERFFLQLVIANIASVLAVCAVWFFAARSARNWIVLQEQAEAALIESEERFRNAMERAPVGMALLSLNQRFDEVNRALCEIVGYSPHELLGRTPEDITYPDDLKKDADLVKRMLTGEIQHYEIEKRYLRKDGATIWVQITGSMLLDKHGAPRQIIKQVQDISARKAWEQHLEKQARTDFLTGVDNRRHFLNVAEQEMARAQRYRTPLSVALLDLDYFKQINDTFGHEVGDRVLKELARICHNTLRELDSVGRMGGEEFAVLFPQTDGEQAFEIAERLRKAIAASEIALEQGPPVHFKTSIGVAALLDTDDNIDALLSRADRALYEAKRSGRNRTCQAGTA